MGVFETFPYTNYQNLNLNYILKKIKEINSLVDDLYLLLNNKLDVYMKEYIDENLSQLIIKAYYVEETKTIVLNEMEEE